MIEIRGKKFLPVISQRFWRNLVEFSLKLPFITDQMHLQLASFHSAFLEFPSVCCYSCYLIYFIAGLNSFATVRVSMANKQKRSSVCFRESKGFTYFCEENSSQVTNVGVRVKGLRLLLQCIIQLPGSVQGRFENHFMYN